MKNIVWVFNEFCIGINHVRVQYNNAFRVLLVLLRFGSASGMFAEAELSSYYAKKYSIPDAKASGVHQQYFKA